MSAEMLLVAGARIRANQILEEDLGHIDQRELATWLAVADWLVNEAAHYARYYPEGHRDGELDTASRHALAVARAYLGEPSP